MNKLLSKLVVSTALITGLCIYCLTGIQTINAQESSTAGNLTLEEIIVTARKREESLMEVPLAITAFTAEDIENLAIKELSDLVDHTPGFYYTEYSVGRGHREHRRLIFRGMQPRTDIQTRQNATVFIDGAPTLGSEIGAIENFERIEMIKGPQSAHFGRSTFAGAINVITKNPGDEFGGSISLEVGKYGYSRLVTAIEGPVGESDISYRLTASSYDYDGQYNNAIQPSQDLGSRSTEDFSLTLYAQPSDKFSAKFRFHKWTDEDGPDVGVGYGPDNAPGAFNCQPGGNRPTNFICGVPPWPTPNMMAQDSILTADLKSRFFNQAMIDAFVTPMFSGFGLERHAEEISLILDYELDSGITIQSITAAHKDGYATMNDVDRRPTAGLTGFILFAPSSADSYQLLINKMEDSHQEIRITSPSDQRLRWLIGAAKSERKGLATRYSQLAGYAPSASTAPLLFEPETVAVFGSIGYDINDKLSVTVEGRQQDDEVCDGSVGGTVLCGTFKSFNPRITADYKINENTMIYFTYAEGTNPGQFNTGLVGRSAAELSQIYALISADVEIDEEELESIEVGIKTEILGGRGQLSIAAYTGDWSNIPIAQIACIINDADLAECIQANGSGGVADISGMELEATARLTENLTLDFTYALNKTKVLEYCNGEMTALLGVPGGCITGMGHSFSRSPEKSGTIALSYQKELNADYVLFARGDLFFRSSHYMSAANITETGSARIVNLRVGVQSDKNRFEVYGTNIFDEKYFTELQALYDLSGLSGPIGSRMVAAGLGKKSEYGVRFTRKF